MNIHEQPFTYFNELLPYAKVTLGRGGQVARERLSHVVL